MRRNRFPVVLAIAAVTGRRDSSLPQQVMYFLLGTRFDRFGFAIEGKTDLHDRTSASSSCARKTVSATTTPAR